jgi:UPF0176 protein
MSKMVKIIKDSAAASDSSVAATSSAVPTESPYLVAAFYKFVKLGVLGDLLHLQEELKAVCLENNIMGTILLAEEGINGTVASTAEGIETLQTFLSSKPCFKDLAYKYSTTIDSPFKKTKILIKNEIITFHNPQINPCVKTGQYVAPEDWNDLISQEDVLLIDTRNDYEIELGTFQGAINPETEKFSDFPKFVKDNLSQIQRKKVAMFCTGGIRCEKASAYLLEQGFEEVYQLDGGILKYLEKIPEDKSLWKGECFIFDNRCR